MSARKEPNASQLVSRIRTEMARRHAAGIADDPAIKPSATIVAPAWKPELATLPSKSEYTLAEILQYDDEEFVESAYAAILRRAPDAAGLASFTQALRSASLSKVEVLGMLRWSEEGKQRSVHIDGLLVPWNIQKWKRVRWIGPMVDWLHTLGRLPRLARAQSLASARGAREIKRLGLLLNQVTEGSRQDIGMLDHRLAEMEASTRASESAWVARQDEVTTKLAALDGMLAEGQERTSSLESKLQASEEQWEALESKLQVTEKQWEALESYKADIDQSRARVDERLDALEAACTRLSDELVDARGRWEREQQQVAESDAERAKAMDPLYAAFEETFRGSRELVAARISRYLVDISMAASADRTQDLVLDIGCGRGEVLEMVRDAGFTGRGIDINEVFVQNCRSLGLDVLKGDAIQVLRDMSTASATAITSLHLVEHLPFEALVQLLQECHRVLRPGGVLILETPNPENILVGSQYFYMDPTHRNPLPPGLLLWLVRSRGFADVRVDRLYEAREVEMPELLDEETAGAASLNMVIEPFRAALDYAVVARKTA